MVLAALVLAAGIGATISGVVGMAGGTFLLAMMALIGVSSTTLIPLHAGVQLVSNTTRVIAHRQHIRWRPFVTLALVATPCPLLGLRLAEHLNFETTKMLMGGVILYAAWVPKRSLPNLGEATSFGVAGILGGTLGVVVGAVGPLIAPFFLRADMNKNNIIATKALCQAYLHVLKIIAFGTIGFTFNEQWPTFLPMAGAVIAGTYLGKWLLGRLKENRFRLLYKVILSALAGKLILGGLL